MPHQGHISEQTKIILEFHHKGLKVEEIVKATSFKGYVIYSALNRQGLEPNGKPVFTFDWPALQAYYNEGNSLRACLQKFKMSSITLTKAVRKGLIKTRSPSDAMKMGFKTGRIKSSPWSQAQRDAQSAKATARGLGGETNYRKYRYKDISMDSKWEVDVAMWLDENNITWERGKHLMFTWIDSNDKSHRYYPDFYLPSYDVYLDPKNKYLVEKDRFKIESVIRNHKVKILWGHKDSVLKELADLSRGSGKNPA